MDIFDPATIDGSVPDRLTTRIRGLKLGSIVRLPDGTQVKAVRGSGPGPTHRHFRIQTVDNHLRSTNLAEDAAKIVLDESAQATHRESIGGPKTYRNYGEFTRHSA